MKNKKLIFSVAFCLLLLLTSTVYSFEWGQRRRGQTVIVCARYSDQSYTKYATGEFVNYVTDSLVQIRNLDTRHPIRLIRVDLMNDTELIRAYLTGPIVLDPLKTADFIANPPQLGPPYLDSPYPRSSFPILDPLYFEVQWEADYWVRAPNIEGRILNKLDEPSGSTSRLGAHIPLDIVPCEGDVIDEYW